MKDASGKWIGLGLGDTDPKVALIKGKLRAKFSYAKTLDTTNYFGADLEFALKTYQTRKNMDGYQPPLRTDGIADYGTQVALGVVTAPTRDKPMLFTLHGTGVSMWDGYPADIARAMLDLYQWQPCFYPATAFPMEPSYRAGLEELRTQVRNWCPRNSARKMALIGYSQGAIVTSLFFKRDVQPTNGEFHYLLEHGRIIGSVTFGNPCRERGVANGNDAAGWPQDDSGGIGDDCMVNTPGWWLDYAHTANSPWGRDVYTATPYGEVGADMRSIWPLIKNVQIGPLFIRLAAMAENPLAGLYNAAIALLYAGMFFIGNPPTGPHINYDPQPAIDYLRSLKGSA